MNDSDSEQADAFAAQYDEAARQHGWNSPEILFGLTAEYLEPGESLLDLGIGTGQSAVPFKQAGLEVFGVDRSKKMLEFCALKGVAVELKQHDIRTPPLPYEDASFNHAIACGVFHLIGDLDDIIAEVARLVRGGGVFAFTTEVLTPERATSGEPLCEGVLEVTNEKTSVPSYLHSHQQIESMLGRNGFCVTKTLDYVAYRKTDWADERSFRAYVARRR